MPGLFDSLFEILQLDKDAFTTCSIWIHSGIVLVKYCSHRRHRLPDLCKLSSDFVSQSNWDEISRHNMESTDWLDYINIYIDNMHTCTVYIVLYAYIVYLRKPLYWRGMWRYQRDWKEMSLSPPLDRLHLVRTITTILAPPSVSMFPPVDLGWDSSDHEPPNRFLTVPVTLHLCLFPHSATLREWKVKVMVGLEGTYLVPEDVVHLLPCHLCSLSIPCQIYTYNI